MGVLRSFLSGPTAEAVIRLRRRQGRRCTLSGARSVRESYAKRPRPRPPGRPERVRFAYDSSATRKTRGSERRRRRAIAERRARRERDLPAITSRLAMAVESPEAIT